MAEEEMEDHESCASDVYDEHLCFLICDGFLQNGQGCLQSNGTGRTV